MADTQVTHTHRQNYGHVGHAGDKETLQAVTVLRLTDHGVLKLDLVKEEGPTADPVSLPSPVDVWDSGQTPPHPHPPHSRVKGQSLGPTL